MFNGSHRPIGKGSLIALKAGQNLTRLTFSVIPLGVISGTVRDPDSEPLQGIRVDVFRRGYRSGRKTWRYRGDSTTDDLGQFRISELGPGIYCVRETLDKMDVFSSKSADPIEMGLQNRTHCGKWTDRGQRRTGRTEYPR